MEGYWPRTFFCVLRAKNSKKEPQYPVILQTSGDIKDLLNGIKNIISLSARFANHRVGSGSSCLLAELAI